LIGIYYTSEDKNATLKEETIASAVHTVIHLLAQHDECIKTQLEKNK